MKKFLFSTLFAMSMIMTMSCSGNQTAGDNEKDSVIVDSIEAVVDSVVVDSVAVDTIAVCEE